MLTHKLGHVLAVLLLVNLASAVSAADKEPIRVTPGNSGPKYEIENEAENMISRPPAPMRSSDDSSASENNEQPNGESEPFAGPIGRISIRRIFLVPVSAPSDSLWSQNDRRSEQETGSQSSDSSSEDRMPSPFITLRRPMWTLPSSPMSPHQHLFGSDSASRSPVHEQAAESNERPQFPSFNPFFGFSPFRPQVEQEAPPSKQTPSSEREDSSMERPRFIDPMQMILDMLQALNGKAPLPASGRDDSNSTDLSKEASSSGSEKEATESAVARPQIPKTNLNETREDIVEIDGKKFLRKVVINRHVGENIIFMTKRLIFVPLNETTEAEVSSTTTTTTTQAPTTISEESSTSTTTTSTSEPEVSSSSEIPSSPSTTEFVPSSSSSPSSTSEPSSSTAASSESATEATTSKQAEREEATTPKEWLTRVQDAIARAAERLEENAGSSTTQSSTSTTSSSTVKPNSE